MILEEGSLWMIFTAVCLASLVGLLEYEGYINLIDDSKSTDDSSIPLNNTSDEMHPLGLECLDHEGLAMRGCAASHLAHVPVLHPSVY